MKPEGPEKKRKTHLNQTIIFRFYVNLRVCTSNSFGTEARKNEIIC